MAERLLLLLFKKHNRLANHCAYGSRQGQKWRRKRTRKLYLNQHVFQTCLVFFSCFFASFQNGIIFLRCSRRKLSRRDHHNGAKRRRRGEVEKITFYCKREGFSEREWGEKERKPDPHFLTPKLSFPFIFCHNIGGESEKNKSFICNCCVAHKRRTKHRKRSPHFLILENKNYTDAVHHLQHTAPEMLACEPHGAVSDLWSVGVILYYCLCGRLPFGSDKCSGTAAVAKTWLDGQLKRVRKADYSFNYREWFEVSRAAKQLVSNLMCIDPEVRMTGKEKL